MTETNDPVRPVSALNKLFYGCGRVAEGVKINSFNLFLFFYFNQVLGLSPFLCGLAVFMALLVDAITDPLVGYWSDTLVTRWGRRHPWIWASPAPLMLSFWLLFAPPAGLGQWGLFFWLMGFSIGVRVSMTLFSVPHLALGAELSRSYTERTSIYSYVVFFGYLGGLGSAFAGYGFFLAPAEAYPNGLLNPQGYERYGAFFAGVMGVAIALCSVLTYRRKLTGRPQLTRSSQSFTELLRNYQNAMQNTSFRALGSGSLIVSLVMGTKQALMIYMATYFWGLTNEEIFLIIVVQLLGMIVAATISGRLNTRWEKRQILMVSTTLGLLLTSGGVSLRLVGWFPGNESIWLLPILVAGSFFATICLTIAVIFTTSMLADVTDEHQLRHKLRLEGVYYSLLSLISKVSSGLGHLMAGLLLQIIAFPESDTRISPETVFNLGLVEGPAMASIGLLALFWYQRYSLSQQEHARILTEIDGVNSRKTAT